MGSEREQAKTIYTLGQAAFERGRYREAIGSLEAALELASGNTILGGKIQLWLVNAYAAGGRQEDAIALCRRLTRHPDSETQQQSKRLLYILEAPKLELKPEWVTQIPDLSTLADGQTTLESPYTQRPKRPRRVRPADPEPLDLSQINTADNQFVWVALVGAAVVLGGLLWLS